MKVDQTVAASRAISLIQKQGVTPLSPCARREDGSLSLCAAAAVAAVGYEISCGTGARRDFEARLEEQPDGALEAAFIDLGWSEQSCTVMRTYNDSRSAASRTREVIEYLSALASVP